PEAQTYTLSPNGIRIEGMPYAELRSVLSYPVIRDEIDRRMEAALCSIQTESLPTTGNSTILPERVTAAFDDLRKELEELKALTEEGLRVIEQMKNPLFPQEETAASLLALDSIDRRIRASSSREVVGFLARPVLEEIIGSGGGKMDTLTVLQNSEKMYAEILESVRFHLSVLEKPKETMLHTEDYS
ncbi:MAG TPA: hypothetical protein PLG43_11590, partial [Spirochaetia bacterium]|nr:hypothetical protein [Spirochaetia bacterium]